MMTIKRILLVDDNEADNVFHEIMLRRAGYTGSMAVCESGHAALDYLNGCRRFPELILVDINMPGMDGFTFAERLAALPQQSAPAQLIILTSSNAQSDIERARALPLISGYLVKPLTTDVALQLLQGQYGAMP